MSHLYSAMATALGGRSGFASSSDGRLRVELSLPDEQGDGTTSGTNPEQLFAAAQAASLLAAIRVVAARHGVSLSSHSNVTAAITLDGTADMTEAADLRVGLTVDIPCIPAEQARAYVTEALALCPYARALRGRVEPSLSVD